MERVWCADTHDRLVETTKVTFTGDTPYDPDHKNQPLWSLLVLGRGTVIIF